VLSIEKKSKNYGEPHHPEGYRQDRVLEWMAYVTAGDSSAGTAKVNHASKVGLTLKTVDRFALKTRVLIDY